MKHTYQFDLKVSLVAQLKPFQLLGSATLLDHRSPNLAEAELALMLDEERAVAVQGYFIRKVIPPSGRNTFEVTGPVKTDSMRWLDMEPQKTKIVLAIMDAWLADYPSPPGFEKEEGEPAVRPGGEEGDWRCMVCETTMTKEHGYGGTDMCGPCCTGDSSLLGELGETW